MRAPETSGAARESFCRFLAACYYQPGPEFAEEKLFESMLEAAGRIDPELAARTRRLGEQFAAERPENLLVEYTRLFLGPVNAIAKPYGSVWLEPDRSLMEDSTMAVSALYAEGGFEIAEDFHELPDHIAAELEFLYLLIFRHNQAYLASDAQALESVTGLRKQLLGEHLGRWVGPFTAAVRSGTQSAFYRELAALTKQFVKMETAVPASRTTP